MIVLLFLIPVSLVIALAFLASFVWAVRTGQFEDTETPALRMLPHDGVTPPVDGPPPNALSVIQKL
jgi:cbb3-type cytochrome oxidase maturation protein